jgi:transposase
MSLSCGMRFIKFTKLEVETLQEGYGNHSSHSVRRRFHAILLNTEGKEAKELASIFQVRTRTIYEWMNRWDTSGCMGLLTQSGQGRPRILSIINKALVELVKKNERTSS